MAADKKVETTGLLGWVDQRFPLTSTLKTHITEYYAPKNFNFWYFFGSLALLVLVIQIVTGIFLVMHYKPDAERAFQSVEYIMRDVPWGWLVRQGVGVHCGEAGCFNRTPHEVFLRWMCDVLDILKSHQIGWALWNFRGSFGVVDSEREDADYADFMGHKVDRKLLTLLQYH